MMRRLPVRPSARTWILVVFYTLATLPAVASAQFRGESLIVRTGGTLSSLVDRILEAGGTVTGEYPHLNAVAASVPFEAIGGLAALPGVEVAKDAPVLLPAPVLFETRDSVVPLVTDPLAEIPTLSMSPLTQAAPDLEAFAETFPLAYQINHRHDHVQSLHAMGLSGEGVVVAVVDTGLRPGFGLVDPARVAGCVSVVPFDSIGCSAAENHGHGTVVAGLIAGQGIYEFDPASVFVRSAGFHAPGVGLDLDPDGFGESIALIGSAPAAEIFMVKAFTETATPTTSGVILAAVDVILAARAGGMNIRVANLSLGTFTLYPGGSALDIAVDALLEAGIVPVVAVGNTGPAVLTAASPSSSRAALAVGAGSAAHQERIAADVGFFGGAGAGQFLRVADDPQTAWFSARGPHADGRGAPHVLADGWVVGVGLGTETNQISIAAGTSFSAPGVAGIAALLAEAEFEAGPIRRAIAESGDPGVVGDGSTAVDQGNGWVSAEAAYGLLEDRSFLRRARRGDPPSPFGPVARGVRTAGLGVAPPVVTNAQVALDPGQRNDFIYEVGANVEQVEFSVSDVWIDPACVPNLVLGDEIRLALHGSKTSAFPPAGFYLDLNPGAPLHGFISPTDPFDAFAPGMPPGVCGDGSCTIRLADPEPGLLRFSLNGATENACTIGARVDIRTDHGPPAKRSDGGKIAPGELVSGSAEVPEGVGKLVVRLSWEGNWSRFPANDLDLALLSPEGSVFVAATLDSPEVLVIDNPAAGFWEYAVFGFELNDAPDHWELSIEADGKALR